MGIDAVNRAVFLDRDGVLTRINVRDGKPYAPLHRADMEVAAGVADALDRLRRAGWLLVVVTNQPEVARGRTTRAEVEAMHKRLAADLGLDDFRVCYHDDIDRCPCRKPQPGMLYHAAVDREIALADSYMVGDRWRDVGAGRQAGCMTVLVESGHTEDVPMDPDIRVPDLGRAAEWILSRRGTR
jgi:D-glycero-D-manno-heptose 1,7-bisphosphate phosphatase